MAAVELYHYEPGCVPDENQVFNDCFDTIKYQLNGFFTQPTCKNIMCCNTDHGESLIICLNWVVIRTALNN